MIDGYVTLEELQVLTCFNKTFLRKLILSGLSRKELFISNGSRKDDLKQPFQQTMFKLSDVEKWIRIHIF